MCWCVITATRHWASWKTWTGLLCRFQRDKHTCTNDNILARTFSFADFLPTSYNHTKSRKPASKWRPKVVLQLSEYPFTSFITLSRYRTFVSLTHLPMLFHRLATSPWFSRWLQIIPLCLNNFTSSSASIIPFIKSVYRVKTIAPGAAEASNATRFLRITSVLLSNFTFGR